MFELDSLVTENLSLVLGLIIIVLYSIRDFNSPGYRLDKERKERDSLDSLINIGEISPRALCSPLRFQIARLAHCVIMLAIFGVLCASWGFLIENKIVSLANQVDGNPISYLLIALIITGFLPNVPWVDKLIAFIKLELHRTARIPSDAHRIFYLLKNNELGFIALKKAIKDKDNPISEQYFSDDVIHDRYSLPNIWLKYLHIYRALVNDSEQQFILSEHLEEVFSIEHIHDEHEKIVNMIKVKGVDKWIDDSDIRIRVLTQIKRMYSLLTFSMLRFKYSQTEVKEHLNKLGFEIFSERRESFKALNTVIAHSGKIVISIALISFGFSILTLIPSVEFSPQAFNDLADIDPQPLGPGEIVFKWTLYSFLMVAPSFLTTYYVRFQMIKSRHWRFKTFDDYKKSNPQREWKIYLLVALLSYSVAALFFFVATKLDSSNDVASGEILLWPLITATITFFTSYRFDTLEPNIEFQNYKCRPKWLSALIQGLVLACLAFLIVSFIDTSGLRTPPYGLHDYILLTATVFIVGIVNGFAMSYHQPNQRREERNSPPEPLIIKLIQQPNSLAGTIENYSDKGLRVVTNERPDFSESQTVILELNEGKEKVQLSGRIRHQDMNSIGIQLGQKVFWERLCSKLVALNNPMPAY